MAKLGLILSDGMFMQKGHSIVVRIWCVWGCVCPGLDWKKSEVRIFFLRESACMT